MTDGSAVDDGSARSVRSLPSKPGQLVDLLFEDSPCHTGRSAGETARLRAEVLLTLGTMGLPDEAVPFVVEELEAGSEPVLVAAAAKAARGRRDPALSRPLVQALWNMAGRDEPVSFGLGRQIWPAPDATTPLLEVLAALRDLGPPAGTRSELERFLRDDGPLLTDSVRTALRDTLGAMPHCCGGAVGGSPGMDDGRRPSSGTVPRAVEVEDQDGVRLVLADFLARAPTALAFFYTRCENPRKCSLTITSLADLCRELGSRLGRVQVAAVTYDPGFDVPARLRRYGRDRGLPFGPAVRMFRAVAEADLLREHFALRVGYTASVVNRHGVELFVLDGGRVVRTWSRQRWAPADVAAALVQAGSLADHRSSGK